MVFDLPTQIRHYRLLTRRERRALWWRLLVRALVVVAVLAVSAHVWRSVEAERRARAGALTRVLRLTELPHLRQELLSAIPPHLLDEALGPLLAEMRYGARPFFACRRPASVRAVAFDDGGGTVGVLGADGRLCTMRFDDGDVRCFGGEIVAAASWAGHGWVLATAAGAVALRDAASDRVTWLRQRGPRPRMVAAQGRSVAVASSARLEVWRDGRPRAPALPENPDADLTAVAMAADGRTVAVGTSLGDVHVVDLDVASAAVTVAIPRCGPVDLVHPVEALELSPDGSRLLARTRDGLVALWGMAGGGARDARVLAGCDDGPRAQVRSAALAGPGAVLMGNGEGRVTIWREGAAHDTAAKLGEAITGIVVSPSRDAFLATGASGRAQLWRLSDAAGGETLVAEPSGHASQVVAAFDREGSRIVTGGGDGQVLVWAARAPRGPDHVAGLGGPAATAVLATVPSTVAAAADGRGEIRLWRPELGPVTVAGARVAAGSIVALAADGGVLAWADGSARLGWARASRPALPTFTSAPAGAAALRPLAVDGIGARALVADRDGVVVLALRAATGGGGAAAAGALRTGAGASAGAFVGDNRVALGRDDGAVEIWDLSSRQRLRVLGEHEEGVSTVAVSADRTRVASLAHDGTVRVVSIEHPGRWWVGQIPLDGVAGGSALAFSASGRALVGARGSTMTIFRLEREGLRPSSLHHARPLLAVAFQGEDHILAIDDGGDLWRWKIGVEALARSLRDEAPKPCAREEIGP